MSEILSSHSSHCVSRILDVISKGGIVCLPTETVYGFVCNPYIRSTIERLYSIKKRPSKKPFALFTSSWERMKREAIEPCLKAERIARHFWPGALTLVLSAREDCPASYEGSVGVRCPDHPLLQAVLDECGGLLINTSMNTSGEPEVRSLCEAKNLVQSADLSIDGGILPKRSVSTVLDCRCDPPVVLRQGDIFLSEISKILAD